MYPDLAETYKTENVQGYAYQNSDKYKTKIDNEYKNEVDRVLGDFKKSIDEQIKADEAELAVLEEKQDAMGTKNPITGNSWIKPTAKYDVNTIAKWKEEGIDFGDQIAAKKGDIESTKACYVSASEVFKAKLDPEFDSKSEYVKGTSPDVTTPVGNTRVGFTNRYKYGEIAHNHQDKYKEE